MACPPFIPKYVSQLRYAQGICRAHLAHDHLRDALDRAAFLGPHDKSMRLVTTLHADSTGTCLCMTYLKSSLRWKIIQTGDLSHRMCCDLREICAKASEMAKNVASLVALDEESTTIDVVRYLSTAKSDDEISEIVSEVDRQGKLLFGSFFSLTFDKSIMAKDFRSRIFIRIPGMLICGRN